MVIMKLTQHFWPWRLTVPTFKRRALEQILATGDVQYYPPVCANVTATFSVLSSTINAVRSDLERLESEPNIREIQELLTRLQRAEQSKLQLTAALHLERMRSAAELQKQEAKLHENSADREESPIDTSFDTELKHQDTVSKLLNESILSLRKRIALAIREINDVLEDLRYTIPEEDED
jgi:DNA repair REX1-B